MWLLAGLVFSCFLNVALSFDVECGIVPRHKKEVGDQKVSRKRSSKIGGRFRSSEEVKQPKAIGLF